MQARPAPPEQVGPQSGRAESHLTTAILITLAALAPLSIDMFLPSIPDITAEFAADSATIRLAVTMYLLVSAGAALLFGPISDRFGRRPALIAGMLLYVLGRDRVLGFPFGTDAGRGTHRAGVWWRGRNGRRQRHRHRHLRPRPSGADPGDHGALDRRAQRGVVE